LAAATATVRALRECGADRGVWVPRAELDKSIDGCVPRSEVDSVLAILMNHMFVWGRRDATGEEQWQWTR
jgi:hypothetical protein